MSEIQPASVVLEAKAKADRIYLHYALALALVLILGGIVLVLLGVGGRVDFVIAGQSLEARFINASPGVVMWVLGCGVFLISRPKRAQVTTRVEEFEKTNKGNVELAEPNATVLGISEVSGIPIVLWESKYGVDIQEGSIWVSLPRATAAGVSLRNAEMAIERQKRLFAGTKVRAEERGTELLREFGRSPDTDGVISIGRVGGELLLSDGWRAMPLPAHMNPMTISRFDVIRLLNEGGRDLLRETPPSSKPEKSHTREVRTVREQTTTFDQRVSKSPHMDEDPPF
jgi:topoisomerase IA-like protein